MPTDSHSLSPVAAPPRELESQGLTTPALILIGLCAMVYFLDGLIHSILGPMAPEIAQSLRLGPAQLGPIFSANLIGQCLGLIAFPIIAARAGQRAVVLICLIGFGLAQCASALSGSAASLFTWRLITGVFLGGCLPSCVALVAAAAPNRKRGLAIMLLFTGYGSGAAVAGVVATSFGELGGWRMTTVAVGALCIVTALCVWLWLKEISSGEDEESSVRNVLGRSNALRLFSSRYLLGTIMLWLLFMCMLTISYCLNSWLPTLLVNTGRDASLAGLSVSVFSVGGIIAGLTVGLLIDRWGAARTLLSFLSLSTVLLFAIGQLMVTASATVLLALLAICGFFVLGAYGGVNVVLASYYPAELRAAGIGWAKSVGRVGTVMTPMLIGAGITSGMTQTAIMSMFSAPALLAVVALAVVARSEARRHAITEPAP
jgi:AAHS family 4-hydroxybenzoate transporter-like MFS transporter